MSGKGNLFMAAMAVLCFWPSASVVADFSSQEEDFVVVLQLDDGTSERALMNTSAGGMIIQAGFTPASYPAQLTQVQYYLAATGGLRHEVKLAVQYAGDSGKVTYLSAPMTLPGPIGWKTIDLTGIPQIAKHPIASGEFAVGFLYLSAATNGPRIGFDNEGEPNDKAYRYDPTSGLTKLPFDGSYMFRLGVIYSGGTEVFIPAGSFYMGCEPNDTHCDSNEFPRHSVQLSAYFIDTYEVTNAPYADYLNNVNPSNNCDGYECVHDMHNWGEMGLYKSGSTWLVDPTYEDRPVVVVTWYGAKDYCESQGKRLPTEAEWEKAAKGATQHYIWPWGDTWVGNAANYWEQGDPYEDQPYYPWTMPGGFFDGGSHGGYQTANGDSPYGAKDMAGNAWEWVSDIYDASYYSQTPPGGWVDPPGPVSGAHRVFRGGSWRWGDEPTLRASRRNYYYPYHEDANFGFRCARD